MTKRMFVLILVVLLGALAFNPVRLLILVARYENPFVSTEQVDTTGTAIDATQAKDGRAATLRSAFYGIDDGLPRILGSLICDAAPGADGMPVIFSHEIDPHTMQAGDFRVTTASGRTTVPTCVTLAPADDPGELRTVLLVGDLGSAEDQPVRLEMVGHILTQDGSATFKEQAIDVTPLEAGPTIVMAEALARDAWRMGELATALPWGGGSGAAPGSRCVVRVVWAGGVTKPGREEIGEDVRAAYRVTLRLADGQTREVVPFAIADLGDGDNNHLLCLDVEGTPVAVELPEKRVVDPNEDWNPATRAPVRSASQDATQESK